MILEKDIFQRTELLMGEEYIAKAKQQKVIIFGVGGVGSWCAEMLIRSGIGHITIVDSDNVAVSNINRQLMATTQTVGKSKVDVLKQRLLEINPHSTVDAIQSIYSPESCNEFELEKYDYIIDAIDSLSNKAHLIKYACQMPGTLFSSMGAALKTDPGRIKTAEFWKVKGCPLGAALRAKLKKLGGVEKKFICVYSDEVRENKGADAVSNLGNTASPSYWDAKKARINGTMSFMPSMVGMTLASLVVNDIDA